MANESAVENISDLVTTATCPGCGQEVNLLTTHLRVTVSPSRSEIVAVDAALVGAETDESGNITALAVDVTSANGDSDGDRNRFYVGTKSGEGTFGYFHSYEHLADWANEQGEVKVTPRHTDPDAEAREASA